MCDYVMSQVSDKDDKPTKTKVSDKDENKITIVKITNYMKTNLDKNLLTELNDKINCLNNFCKEDGCGLTSGTLIDMFITKFLTKNLSEFLECHNNEADCTYDIWFGFVLTK